VGKPGLMTTPQKNEKKMIAVPRLPISGTRGFLLANKPRVQVENLSLNFLLGRALLHFPDVDTWNTSWKFVRKM
jgi:hypothetical protein